MADPWASIGVPYKANGRLLGVPREQLETRGSLMGDSWEPCKPMEDPMGIP